MFDVILFIKILKSVRRFQINEKNYEITLLYDSFFEQVLC